LLQIQVQVIRERLVVCHGSHGLWVSWVMGHVGHRYDPLSALTIRLTRYKTSYMFWVQRIYLGAYGQLCRAHFPDIFSRINRGINELYVSLSRSRKTGFVVYDRLSISDRTARMPGISRYRQDVNFYW